VKVAVNYVPFEERELALDPPRYFKTDTPDPAMMTYRELRDYVTRLEASGAYAVPDLVGLHRKVAFPFVTVIMTMLAVPFAAATGRRGSLYGIGVGIVLAIVYWVMLSLFGALGVGGVLTPILAAWAPNILFSAIAVYLMLAVRT
jgi:lipopolysaccharide export LptBFGC system permease protein LptF